MQTTAIKKMLTGLTILTTITINSFAQIPNPDRNKFENTTTKIEKNNVPKLIISNHYKEFPDTANNNWFGYPNYSINSDWFDKTINLSIVESPKYYIVEFKSDTILHRLTYNTLVEKINTYISIDNKIQTKIAKTLIDSKYKNWEITNEKEEIFRDLDLDILTVYKIEIQKNNKKRYLFYTENGLLIKDIEITL